MWDVAQGTAAEGSLQKLGTPFSFYEQKGLLLVLGYNDLGIYLFVFSICMPLLLPYSLPKLAVNILKYTR